MHEDLDTLEDRMVQLRRAIRSAMARQDPVRVKDLRADLRHAERAWNELADSLESAAEQPDEGPSRLERGSGPAAAPLLPAREQVHQVLTLLGVPAAPKLIGAVHRAFFSGDLPASRLASLRRDEERSFRSAPNIRPYYLCPALTADLLAPARALLTVSSWPLERRVIGAHSPRVDFLTAAVRIAAAVTSHRELREPWAPGPMAEAERLLQSFAVSISGALPPPDLGGAEQILNPNHVARAAEAELAVHTGTDEAERAAAADRARQQLSEADRLFGTRFTTVPGAPH
jgi:hypothetical protein